MKKLLVITFVKPGHQAQEIGIQLGDIIVSYDGTPISTNEEFSSTVLKAKNDGKEQVQLKIRRGDKEINYNITTKSLGIIAEEKELRIEGIVDNVVNDYKTSIAICKFISFIGWIAVIIGIVSVIILIDKGQMALLGIPISIAVSLIGLLTVMGGQASRAVMDNANYSRQMLEVLRKQVN